MLDAFIRNHHTKDCHVQPCDDGKACTIDVCSMETGECVFLLDCPPPPQCQRATACTTTGCTFEVRFTFFVYIDKKGGQ